MATRFKSVIALLSLALAMGCVAPAPLPTATPVPFLAIQLDVRIDPKDAATFVLNPSPLGKGGYSQGMVVTIDILPKQGWLVDRWVGPVFNIDGMTAQIEMDSSQTVAVRLKPTTPGAMPTNIPTTIVVMAPPPTAVPTATPRPIPTATQRPTNKPFPTATLRPTYTPLPTYTPFPTPTATPRPTYTPFPTLIPTPRPTTAPDVSSYYREGEIYYDSGNYHKAISELTTVIKLFPGYKNAYWFRGMSYGGLGQYQKAIQDLDKAIQQPPGASDLLYSGRAYYHYKAGQYQRAIQDYDKAIQIWSSKASYYNNRGFAYRKLGQDAKADADKAKACSLDKQYC